MSPIVFREGIEVSVMITEMLQAVASLGDEK